MIIFGQRTFFSFIKLDLWGKGEFYLFCYNVFFFQRSRIIWVKSVEHWNWWNYSQKLYICLLLSCWKVWKNEEKKVNVIIIEYVWLCLNVPK